jgi:hypothetical protein
MKKTVITYGLVSAGLALVAMAFTLPALYRMEHATADAFGYASIVLAALIVLLGIRSYRERTGGLRFGRGVAVGLGITLLSTAIYAAAFATVYFGLVPDFGEKMVACMVERERVAGADAAKLAETAARGEQMKRIYDHPAGNVAMTFGVHVPIGLAASLIASAILRRRPPGADPAGRA